MGEKEASHLEKISELEAAVQEKDLLKTNVELECKDLLAQQTELETRLLLAQESENSNAEQFRLEAQSALENQKVEFQN